MTAQCTATERETTKATTIFCYFRHLLRISPSRNVRYGVKNDSVASSSTTGTPHEYFLRTGAWGTQCNPTGYASRTNGY